MLYEVITEYANTIITDFLAREKESPTRMTILAAAKLVAASGDMGLSATARAAADWAASVSRNNFV